MAHTSDGGLLEFETAMLDFEAMFPNLPRERIESALRNNDGDVANTIDQLLAEMHTETTIHTPPMKPKQITPERRTQSHDLAETYAQAHHLNDSILRASAAANRPGTSGRSRSNRGRLSVDEICRETAIIRHWMNENEEKLDRVSDEKEARVLEDEQIALMLQNQEFIGYLKRDPEFVKGVLGNSRAPGGYHSHIRKTSRNNYHEEPPAPIVPNGPFVDGPLTCQKSGFAQKLKNKIQTVAKGTPPPMYTASPATSSETYEQSVGYDPFPYTVTLGYNTQNDNEFKSRLKNMSKTSKARLTQLASIFKKERNPSMDGPQLGHTIGHDPRSRSSLDSPPLAPPPYDQRDYYY
ncbi:unnamed protein product, partial [Mesorhabditis spiculigera]